MKKIFTTQLSFLILLSALCSVSCQQHEPDQGAGLQIWDGDQHMDKAVRAGDDFYSYANGTWLAQNPSVDGVTEQVSNFGQIGDEQERKLNQLISTTNDPTIVTLLRLVSEDIRNWDFGTKAIRPTLDKILAVTTREQLYQAVAYVVREGYSPFFTVSVIPNSVNERIFKPVLFTCESHYTAPNFSKPGFIENYTSLIASTIKNTCPTIENADQIASKAVEIEMRLSGSNPESINPLHYNTPERIASLIELQSTRTATNLTEMLALCGINRTDIIGSGEAMKSLVLMEKMGVEDLKNYLLSYVIIANRFNIGMVSQLGWTTFENQFNIPNTERNNVQKEKAIRDLKKYVPEHLSRLYSQTYVKESDKQRLEHLATDLHATMRHRLNNNQWMGEGTRQRAVEKLDNMRFLISHPASWPEFKSSELSQESYCAALSCIRRDAYARKLDLMGTPLDLEHSWKYMMTYSPSYTFNCLYHSALNAMIIESTFTMSPIFSSNYSDAYNYGTIGTVIAHEISHGFDNAGSLLDKTGAMADWWEASDKQKFSEKQQAMIKWFSSLEIYPGLMGNGELTLSENIADLGGVAIASEAFEQSILARGVSEADRKTEMQHFYLSYAQLWRLNGTEATHKYLWEFDDHSVGSLRVNGIVPMIDKWYEAFDVVPTDKMYLKPSERIQIW